MNSNERVELFLKYQDENMSFKDISEKMDIKPTTLRRTLNKYGYKSDKGKYVRVDNIQSEVNQITFEDINKNTKSNNSKEKEKSKDTIKKKSNSKKSQKDNKKEVISKKTTNNKKQEVNEKHRKITPKKDRKINITQEDLDKICEVYDWYIQVRDMKALNPKKLSNKKDINIEDNNIENVKSVNIRVDKDTWEDFERLCSNSSYNKKEIITQAIKDFMKTYKNLL